MPTFRVETPQRSYDAVVERGSLSRVAQFLPSRAGLIFVVTTRDVWELQGASMERALDGRPHRVLFFPGGEARKRLTELETLAEQMMEAGGDRSSAIVAFGGGIVGDVAGFLAAVFMRGIPVIQVPTTLLAQVDAAVGGKTGVNLVAGKNLLGSFHQPLAVLIDPNVLKTLPEREYRAGLYEIIKCGVIRDADLFTMLDRRRDAVLAQEPAAVEQAIASAVCIKAEVVTADEREGDLRRILNFGHTVGHALEAETRYERLLHGEAVAFGMRAATVLAERTGRLSSTDAAAIHRVVSEYGPIPPLDGIEPQRLAARLRSDKKTVQGQVHFVLPVRIGAVEVVTGVPDSAVLESIGIALEQVAPGHAVPDAVSRT
ncbi:MAG TPA: 3-dehydroquinate synthase [Bryobacteraceae bacterium]|nr:3-dehydroquinate synthase [Bryobacteraceae bacterium]